MIISISTLKKLQMTKKVVENNHISLKPLYRSQSEY